MSIRFNINDLSLHLNLAPHTLTKPSALLRCGLLTNVERFSLLCPDSEIGFITTSYLNSLFKPIQNAIEIHGGLIPNQALIEQLKSLNPGEQILYQGMVIAKNGQATQSKAYQGPPLIIIANRWDLFKYNGEVLTADFHLLKGNKTSQALPNSCRLIGDPSLLFIEENATLNDVTLNVSSGPIYLSADSEIMEGSLIRGPFGLGPHAQIKMGAKIYGATTVGPHCKVGGEVNNVIFESYSNKSHDGFLGNGYIGSWCNIGADTNASNLMNNYGIVEVHDYNTGKNISSEEQFVGLHMGDHAKCGINTMFNTGTTVGVGCNIYGPGFFKKHIPSFSFGEPTRLFPYRFDKAMEGILSMMARRQLKPSEEEVAILKYIHENRELF